MVVQGEWGRVEELTLTYVSLRLWDERRLMLPVSHFANNPFENWTRHEAGSSPPSSSGSTWTVPIPEVRAELHRAIKENPLWDQKDWTLQVIDVLPNGLVEIRALMSAADSASACGSAV